MTLQPKKEKGREKLGIMKNTTNFLEWLNAGQIKRVETLNKEDEKEKGKEKRTRNLKPNPKICAPCSAPGSPPSMSSFQLLPFMADVVSAPRPM